MSKKRSKIAIAPPDLAELTLVEQVPSKVDITVGGHSVSVESTGSLDYISSVAIDLFRRTQDDAKKIPFGFDVHGGEFERADPPIREPGSLEPHEWEDDRAGMGRQPQTLRSAA